MTPSILTLRDLERSKSRSLRFWVVGHLYGIHIFASSNIATLIWMSQKGVCWQAGFPAVPAVFLVLFVFFLVGIWLVKCNNMSDRLSWNRKCFQRNASKIQVILRNITCTFSNYTCWCVIITLFTFQCFSGKPFEENMGNVIKMLMLMYFTNYIREHTRYTSDARILYLWRHTIHALLRFYIYVGRAYTVWMGKIFTFARS